MGPILGWGNVWGTSVTVPVTISTSYVLTYTFSRHTICQENV